MMTMMGFWVILPLLLIGGVVVVIALALGWRTQSNQTRPDQTNQAPLEILKARYANGEISREEYDQMRLDLEG